MSNPSRGRGGQRGGGGAYNRGGGGYRGGAGADNRGGGDYRGGGGMGNRGGGDYRGGGGTGNRGGGEFRSNRGGGGGYGGRGGGRGGLPSRTRQPVYLENVNTPMPDKTSHDLENAIVAKPRDLTSKDFPARPGYGTAGKAIILRANYFQLKTASTNKDLYRYNVSVMEKEGKKDKGDRGTSVGLSKPKTRRLMEMILESDLFRGKTWATDYSSIIVTTEKLSLGGAAYKGEIELRDANQPAFPAPQATDSTQIKEARRRRTQKFKIEASGTFDLTQLISYVQSKSPYLQSKDDMIQLLNIIIAKTPNTSTNVYTFAQNKFYPDGHSLMESHDLKGGLRALRGYYSSVRTATNRILVNLNVSSAAFYPPIPLVELIGRYREANHFANPPQQQQLIKLETFLRMLQVSTHYLKALDAEGHVIKGADGRPIVVHKTRTIVGFARTPRCGNAETVSFQYRDPNSPQATESTISVFDYFQNHHGITLQIPKIPVLNVGTISKPSYLPAELATVLPGQAVRRLLSGQQTADMITFAARAPHLNALSISGNGLSMMGLAPNLQADTVNKFGFQVDTDMITVHGRILSAPQLAYAAQTVNPSKGSWNLIQAKFSKPGEVTKWKCLVLNQQGQYGSALRPESLPRYPGLDDLLNRFDRELQRLGLRINQRLATVQVAIPPPTSNARDRVNTILNEQIGKAADEGVKVLLIILRENDKWLYSRIKFYGDVKHGISTINCVGSKLQKERPEQYIGNVALKFNVKGGGDSHTIRANMHPFDERTMLVGIDVTHPSPGSTEGSPSIAAVVANVDKNLCQWPGSIMTQTGRVEVVEGLTAMILERLDLFYQKNKNRLPDKIIVYRDGVSEGQYKIVLERELPAIQAAFEKRYGDEKKWPKLTIIIVGKRHHTRFYPTRQEDADDRSGNPLPGTVVDRGVTQNYLWDFYLQAHTGLQGTARPAHYVVLKDEIKFKQDQLEQFTHNLCYLFNRATKAVSICPPAYYADLLCERGRCYLYKTLNEDRDAGALAYNATTAEWTRGVHPRIKDTTFYI